MILSLDRAALSQYVIRQMAHFFPDGKPVLGIGESMDRVLQRVEACFGSIHNIYYRRDGQVFFNHLNTDHYSMFLYFLSNALYKNGMPPETCDKVFYLNKALHGIDVFYSVELPDVFIFSHPVGAVLGKAKYGNYFLVSQNCTVGSNHDVDYPIIGEYVALYAGAAVLGKSRVSSNCKISAGSILMDKDLEPGSIYIGEPRNHLIKKCRHHDRIWDSKL